MRRATWLLWPVITLLIVSHAAAQLTDKERKRKELNDKLDKLHLREKTQFVVDCSPDFLREPRDKQGKTAAGEYTIARAVPTVKLQILPNIEPQYFSAQDQYMSCWANWANMARSADNRFFLAASDHLARGCDMNLYEYRPEGDTLRRVLDVSKLLGWSKDMYTDGKIHGHMGILSDGTLWTATHHGVEPKAEWYQAGYRGSWLLTYNIHSGEAKNWGVPLVGNSLPCFAMDTRRGRLVGTGYKQTMLCWDCREKKVRFAGYPPKGWVWWDRAMLCDDATGIFWGMDVNEEPYHFMSFDPELNRFQRYDVTVPENPVTHKTNRLRGCTSRPAVDGYYYWATWNGALLKFKPTARPLLKPPETPEPEKKTAKTKTKKPAHKTDENADDLPPPTVVPAGVTWDQGRDVLQLALDPTGRYIYYYGAPVVQYDVKTGKKKVIAFIDDFLFEKYGYWPGYVYGMEISTDGSFLVICVNGTFSGKGVGFGHPAVVVVSIPQAERPMD